MQLQKKLRIYSSTVTMNGNTYADGNIEEPTCTKHNITLYTFLHPHQIKLIPLPPIKPRLAKARRETNYRSGLRILQSHKLINLQKSATDYHRIESHQRQLSRLQIPTRSQRQRPIQACPWTALCQYRHSRGWMLVTAVVDPKRKVGDTQTRHHRRPLRRMSLCRRGDR